MEDGRLPSPEPRRATGHADPVALRGQIWLPWSALAAILLSATRTDPDLWGHVRFGLDWLRTWQLPAVDPYSFTQDRAWVNHEWLSEAAMGAAFRVLGPAGLVLLKVAVMGTACAVLLRRLRGATPVFRVSVATIALIGALPLSATVRPQIWSVLGLALLVLLLDDRRPGLRRAGLAALLFAAWANLHGGWITGGAALALHALLRSLRAPRDAAAWAGLGAASLVATLVNPYGVGLWTFLAVTVRASRPDISEWQPFTLHEPLIMWVSIVVPLAAVLLLMRRRATRPPLEALAVACLLIFAGLRVSRVAPLICLPVLALLGPWLAQSWGARGALSAPTRGAAVVLFMPAVLALFAARAPVTAALSCIAINDVWAPDRLAAASLAGAAGRLWTTFNWGEYAIWHTGPVLRVSIDGRRETVYSDDVIEWHRAVERGDPGGLTRLFTLAPEYVWLPNSHQAARQVLLAHGYRVEVQTAASFVAVRADRPPLPSGRAALPACFP